MPVKQGRLNRRRYKEAIAALKSIICDAKQPAARRLRATEMLLSIYDRHDKNEQRKDAKRRAADAPDTPRQAQASPEARDGQHEPRESVEAFLTRVGGSTDEGDE